MEIVSSRAFKKDYKKLSKANKEKFASRLQLFLDDPKNSLLNIHKLNPPFQECVSINITGDIRLIVEQREGVVLLVRIGTHSELYN